MHMYVRQVISMQERQTDRQTEVKNESVHVR